MNKVKLAQRLANQFGFTQREGLVIVDQVLQAMALALQKGKRVEIRGLGTFGTKERRASIGRVVKTGRVVRIPELRRVYFRPGQELKEIHPSVMS
jgi:integration host factor subunit beta